MTDGIVRGKSASVVGRHETVLASIVWKFAVLFLFRLIFDEGLPKLYMLQEERVRAAVLAYGFRANLHGFGPA